MSGEILFLAHRLPYPPDRGDRIRSWHMLRALTRLAPVHVIAPVDFASDLRHRGAVEAIAASVTTAVRPPSKGLAVARALLTGRPASVELFSVPALHAAVATLLARGNIRTIVAFSGQMAHYVPRDFAGRFIMDFVDMDSAKFDQLGGFANRQEGKRLLAWEIAAAKRADHSLFVSGAEAEFFTSRTGITAEVIENAIDAALFNPALVTPIDAQHPLIVFTGQMDYRPNIDAVVGFVRDVLPLTNVHFAIVGRNPAPQVRALASDRVTVTGEVPDTRPWLAAADVVVAPLALARGIQNKVLEAMAVARPVVLSSAAAQGIDAEDGVHFRIADGPTATAAAINALLVNATQAMGNAARARVLDRYDWAACLSPLAAMIAP